MTANGFLPQILQPTRISDSSMTLIDNIYTNTFSSNISGGNVLIEIADHLVQFISVDKDIALTSEPNIYIRDYNRWNDKSFLDDLSSQNWNIDHQDINEMYDDFIWRFKGCVDKHAPLKKLNKKKQKLNNKPWITPFI